VTTPPESHSPFAEAMEWVSRIAAVAMIMVLPGLGGQWLDGRLGTKFIGPLGFALGVTSGVGYLVALSRSALPYDASRKAGTSNDAVKGTSESEEGTGQEQMDRKP
jgi:hypothetical protein